jgi:hypothetical protein
MGDIMEINESLQQIAKRLLRENICTVPLSASDLETVEKYIKYYTTSNDLCRRLSDIELNYVQISSDAEEAAAEVKAIKEATEAKLRHLTQDLTSNGYTQAFMFSVSEEDSSSVKKSFFLTIEFLREQLKALSNDLITLSESAAQVRACAASFNEVYKESKLAVYAFTLNRDVEEILEARSTLLQAHASVRECERTSSVIMGNTRCCSGIINCINNMMIETAGFLGTEFSMHSDNTSVSPIKAINRISIAISMLSNFKIENYD